MWSLFILVSCKHTADTSLDVSICCSSGKFDLSPLQFHCRMVNGAIYVSTSSCANLLLVTVLEDNGPGLGPSADLALCLSLVGLVFQPSLSMVVRGGCLIV